jgi:hypothetical protein
MSALAVGLSQLGLLQESIVIVVMLLLLRTLARWRLAIPPLILVEPTVL